MQFFFPELIFIVHLLKTSFEKIINKDKFWKKWGNSYRQMEKNYDHKLYSNKLWGMEGMVTADECYHAIIYKVFRYLHK